MGRFWSQLWTVAAKDLRLELRSRERAVAMGVFAALVAVIFAFALDPSVRPRTVAGAMLWVTSLLAGTLGLGRSFAPEREDEALTGTMLAPVSPAAVYGGKTLANLLVLLLVEIGLFAVFTLFFGFATLGALAGLAIVVALGTLGLVALGTLFSAVATHTRLGETLLPILLFPLLLPVVIFAASSTQRLLAGRPLSEIAGNLRVLLAFDLIFVFVSAACFGSVLED